MSTFSGPLSPNGRGVMTAQYQDYLTSMPQTRGLNDLTPEQLLQALSIELQRRLRTMRDEAKFMYEEEGDDTSFGEYQGLQSAIKIVDETLASAPSKVYSVPSTPSQNWLGFDPYRYLGHQPHGHT